MRGIAFHRIHEVGYEVGTALVLVLYLGPLGIDILFCLYHAVVAARGECKRHAYGGDGKSGNLG